MLDQKTLYYRINRGQAHIDRKDKYQLMGFPCNVPHVIMGFAKLRDLKKYAHEQFPDAVLQELSGTTPDKSPLPETDHVYLPLKGDTVRGLSWGMSRKKVARIEQIDGGEHVMIKNGVMEGFDVTIQLGFDEWAHSGLEYIAFSSQAVGFHEALKKEMDDIYGESAVSVDFHGLDGLMQAGKIKNPETLIHFVKDPQASQFNRFVKDITGLTFRSAIQWQNKVTTCLMYAKFNDAPGERNRHNHTYVIEFCPTVLFDLFLERFAELYLTT